MTSSALHSIPSAPRRVLRIADVCDRVGLSSTTVWRLQRAGRFPPPVRLTDQAVGWRESDVEDWLANRPVASPEDRPGYAAAAHAARRRPVREED